MGHDGLEHHGSGFSRRDALRAMGALAAASLAGSSGRAGAPASAAALPCVVTPAETEGPFFVDERLKRSDVTTGTTRASVVNGVPLALRIAVYAVNGGACAPLAGATVDIWHTDALGVYSDVAALNTGGQTFLRGYQVTDANGTASFSTIYPGWYPGRTVHIHFKVRTPSASGSTTHTFTSQLFVDDAISTAVFAAAPYNTRGARDMTNARDSIYNSSLLLPLQRSSRGYSGTFSVGLNVK